MAGRYHPRVPGQDDCREDEEGRLVDEANLVWCNKEGILEVGAMVAAIGIAMLLLACTTVAACAYCCCKPDLKSLTAYYGNYRPLPEDKDESHVGAPEAETEGTSMSNRIAAELAAVAQTAEKAVATEAAKLANGAARIAGVDVEAGTAPKVVAAVVEPEIKTDQGAELEAEVGAKANKVKVKIPEMEVNGASPETKTEGASISTRVAAELAAVTQATIKATEEAACTEASKLAARMAGVEAGAAPKVVAAVVEPEVKVDVEAELEAEVVANAPGVEVKTAEMEVNGESPETETGVASVSTRVAAELAAVAQAAMIATAEAAATETAKLAAEAARMAGLDVEATGAAPKVVAAVVEPTIKTGQGADLETEVVAKASEEEVKTPETEVNGTDIEAEVVAKASEIELMTPEKEVNVADLEAELMAKASEEEVRIPEKEVNGADIEAEVVAKALEVELKTPEQGSTK